MGLETATYPTELVATNPVGSTDTKAQGDDHIRMIKAVLQATFPGFAGRLGRVQSKTANYTVVLNDNSTLLKFGGTSWTLAYTAVATLGNGHYVFFYSGASGDVTIDPDGTETINGATTLVIKPNQFGIIFCDGTALVAIVIPGLAAANTWTAIQTFNAANVHAAVETWQRQQYFPTFALTDAANISWDLDLAQVASITLGGNRTLTNPTNKKNGGHYTLHVIQDATGGRTLAFGSEYKWPGAVAPVVSAAANARDVVSIVSDGTNMFCNIVQDIR